MSDIFEMYSNSMMSIPEISKETGMPRSTVRRQLKSANVLRSRADGVRLAGTKGKLGLFLKGKKNPHSSEMKALMSAGHRNSDRVLNAKGVSQKPNGYIEHTTGEHKGRSVHVVTMENIIGRRITAEEVVHHRDEDRSNNDPENLQLMTRSEHAAHHGLENHIYRNRNEYGQFK